MDALCVCIYVCVCVCVHVYACMCIYTHLLTYTHTQNTYISYLCTRQTAQQERHAGAPASHSEFEHAMSLPFASCVQTLLGEPAKCMYVCMWHTQVLDSISLSVASCVHMVAALQACLCVRRRNVLICIYVPMYRYVNMYMCVVVTF
jgi:hypothetical protein